MSVDFGSMDTFEFEPMRSLIYVDLAKEEYRHKLLQWLNQYHVPDSISQFEPYVTKYAFYYALPVPPDGKRFGTVKLQLTEHYWLANIFQKDFAVKTFSEYMPKDVLRWQGIIPDTGEEMKEELGGDAGRKAGSRDGMPPFIFAFIPVCWEKDFKGSERRMIDGANYRWQFMVSYPDGVSEEEGDKWLYEEIIPAFVEMPETNRILSSRIYPHVNDCPYQRVVEMWFDGPSDWHKAAVEKASNFEKPSWAQQDVFPFLKPRFNISSIFLTDRAYRDNLRQRGGYIAMR